MGLLGDLFPEEEKIKAVLSQMTPGRVFYLFCDFTTPPKDKYLLLACVEPKPLFFVINSGIHDYIKKRPELLHCQVCITASEHDFLNHNSYVNCIGVIDSFHIKDVEQQVLKSLDRIKGMINTAAKEQVISAVKGTQTINKLYKDWIIKGLEG